MTPRRRRRRRYSLGIPAASTSRGRRTPWCWASFDIRDSIVCCNMSSDYEKWMLVATHAPASASARVSVLLWWTADGQNSAKMANTWGNALSQSLARFPPACGIWLARACPGEFSQPLREGLRFWLTADANKNGMYDLAHLHLLSPRAGGRLEKVILSRVLPGTAGNSVLCQRRPGLNC